MYSEVLRHPKSGYLAHLDGTDHSDIGEEAEDEVVPPQCYSSAPAAIAVPRLWVVLVIAAVICGWWCVKEGGVLGGVAAAGGGWWVWGGPGWSRLKESLRKWLGARVVSEMDRLERVQGRIALQFYEVRQVGESVALEGERVESMKETVSEQIEGVRAALERYSCSLLPSPLCSPRLHLLHCLRLHTQLFTQNPYTPLSRLVQFWYFLACSCSSLDNIHSELAHALSSAYLLLTPPPPLSETNPDSHSFEAGELRRLHMAVLSLVHISKSLYDASINSHWSDSVEIYNALGEGIDTLVSQHQISGHYLLALLKDPQYRVYKDRVVPALQIPAEPHPLPTPPPPPQAAVGLDASDSDDSDSAYVYEGVADLPGDIPSTAPTPDIRAFRLSQRTMTELREKMQGRPKAKVKRVCGVDLGREEKKEGERRQCPDTTLSEGIKNNAKRLMAELMGGRGCAGGGEVLEG